MPRKTKAKQSSPKGSPVKSEDLQAAKEKKAAAAKAKRAAAAAARAQKLAAEGQRKSERLAHLEVDETAAKAAKQAAALAPRRVGQKLQREGAIADLSEVQDRV